MSKVTLNQIFLVGFVFGFLLFTAINIYSINANYRGYIDGFGETGFPFLWMDSGWFLQRVLWLGLIADVLIAVVFSFILGLVCRFVWSKITAQKLKVMTGAQASRLQDCESNLTNIIKIQVEFN